MSLNSLTESNIIAKLIASNLYKRSRAKDCILREENASSADRQTPGIVRRRTQPLVLCRGECSRGNCGLRLCSLAIVPPVRRPEGYISELFVRKSARGQGIGTRLLAAVEDEAATRGCSRLRLLNLRNRESYQRGFYRKRGWEEWQDAANFIYSVPKK